NGKSFDAPLLETRYLFHRINWTPRALPHIDVLHPARGFWSTGVCSLGTLERKLLGVSRVGDVAGIEIPSRYFEFVRSGDARPLRSVLEHNRLDLLSLAALTSRLLRLIASGVSEALDAQEALALARIYERARRDEDARSAWVQALTMVCRDDVPEARQ